MALRIPNELLSGFQVLTELSLNDIEKISSYLSTIPTGVGPNEFVKLLTSKFDYKNLVGLSHTIYSLGSILSNFNEPNEEISKQLKNALEEDFDKDIDLSDIEKKLNLLLVNSQNLKSTFKALDLLTENNIIYRDSRIFSDIRLLFNENLKKKEKKREGLIIHRLKIESNSNGRNENFYISLDSNDLLKFKELINRAIEKDKQIKSDYQNINFIELTE